MMGLVAFTSLLKFLGYACGAMSIFVLGICTAAVAIMRIHKKRTQQD